MKENFLLEKSKGFALRVIKLYRYLNDNQCERILTIQLLRCGTSIGANVKESVFAQTKADFTSKLFIAQKECAETEYWLELLYESGYMSNAEFHSIYEDCEELMRLLVSSTKTSQGK